MFTYPEQFRLRDGAFYSLPGEPGAFQVVLTKPPYVQLCIIAASAEGWEHVSVHVIQNGRDRTPTWEEMCLVKGLFWGAEDCVLQYHPPASEYVNRHLHTLHLWRPVGIEIPTPPKILIG